MNPVLIPDLVGNFIASLNLSADIEAISGNQITVSKTFQARKGLQVLLDATAYTVESVDYANAVITLTENVVGNPSIYSIAPPFYFHGTALMINAHLSRIKSSADKMPLIWLMEVVREQKQGEQSALEVTAPITLFFLDEANPRDWNTDQHYSLVVTPQRLLVDEFIEQIRSSKEFFQQDIEVEIITHVNFGQYIDGKGHVQSVFNERTSGIEVSFTLQVKKCCTC